MMHKAKGPMYIKSNFFYCFSPPACNISNYVSALILILKGENWAKGSDETIAREIADNI
jgi:hypothetical protein